MIHGADNDIIIIIIIIIYVVGRDAENVSVGKCEGKSSLGRPWHRWDDNIKMDLLEMEW